MLSLGLFFSPQEICIRTPWVLWGIVISDLLIFVAYSWMPISVWRIHKRVVDAGEKVPFKPMWSLVRAFIGFCGLTHLLSAAVIFFVMFRVLLGALIATALVSLLTAYLLHRIAPLLSAATVEFLRLSREVKRSSAVHERQESV